MAWGNFSPDGREYVITEPYLPRPWLNFLTNGIYSALVSQTGGGYSFVGDSGFNRLTRVVPGEFTRLDQPGRYLYLRDQRDGSFWGLTGQPVKVPWEAWECRHGFGHSTITSRYREINSRVTYFVPEEETLEIWHLTLRNEGRVERRLSLFTYAEMVLGNYSFDLNERCFADLFNESTCREGVLFAGKRYWNVPGDAGSRGGTRFSSGNANKQWNKHVFHAASVDPVAYETRGESFRGIQGELNRPATVVGGRLTNGLGRGEELVTSLQVDLVLNPGEEISLSFLLGTAAREEEAIALREKYRVEAEVHRALNKVVRTWEKRSDQVTCSTPDQDFDLSVNHWNKYQAWNTFNFSRMASAYIGGGSMIGFRDTCQDTYGILPLEAGRARGKIVELLQHQLSNGSTVHNWDPLTGNASVTGHTDDPLWLILTVTAYLKESGDMSFLEEPLRFHDHGSASVYEHLCRAIDHSLSLRRTPGAGGLGLSLMGAADWNDGLDQVGILGRGESVFTSLFLAWMLQEMAVVTDHCCDTAQGDLYRREFAKTKEQVNAVAWDGEWYVRGRTDHGEVFGSRENRYGSIYLNPQTWAILSGVATPERAKVSLDSVRRLLDTPYGPCLLAPAYQDPDPSLGIITRFSPGTKENGTIFVHPVAWLVIAECLLGRGNQAYEYFRKTSFVVRGREPQAYWAEPYVYCEFVDGPDSARSGRGSFSWLTGTAAWMWRACLDYILGVRPEYGGLRVAPCIPAEWRHASVRRAFRGAVYEIQIENPQGVNEGVARVELDGQPLDGNLLPPGAAGETYRVRVVLGGESAKIKTVLPEPVQKGPGC